MNPMPSLDPPAYATPSSTPSARPSPALLLLTLAVAAAPSFAATPPKTDTPADYSHALPLQISGQQGVVGLRLPAVVYLKARSAGLDDLRIFDARGVAQPYALHRPATEATAQRGKLPASIFAVRGKPADAVGSTLDLDIRTRPDGSVSSVRARTGKTSDDTPLSSLLLDFGGAANRDASDPPRIEALRFSPPENLSDYSAEVWLEVSQDLKQWDALGATELNWLKNEQAETLANDRLEFSPQSFRYARLSWRRGEPAKFAAIDAETVLRQGGEPQRETLWLKPVAGKQPGDLVYPAGIALPVEQVSLRLSEPNIVYPLALGDYLERPSRQVGKATEWRFQPRVQTTFYQITQNGQSRRSGALNVAIGQRQDWVLRPLNAAASAQPELGLAWQPATLVFLAGGTPPYTLHFGRADADPASQRLDQVAPGFTTDELKQLELASTGELRSGQTESASASAAAQASAAARQRSFILWGVLLLGVAVLGGMAWRLVRQMKAEPTKPQ
jgi:hypothetical protein